MELTAQELLALLPMGTALVLALRLVVGVRTIGAFAPVLLSLTTMQLGTQATATMLLVAGGTGLMISPVVDRLALTRGSRLAVVVVGVCASLVATGAVAADAIAFPIVVMAIVIERTWDSAQVDGPLAGVRLFSFTLIVAFAVAAALSAMAPYLTDRHWMTSAALGAAANILVGSYRGVRLTERRRFSALIAHQRPVSSAAAVAAVTVAS
jgi:7 transmembrane helices usually fused to an inactive transglutaminase